MTEAMVSQETVIVLLASTSAAALATALGILPLRFGRSTGAVVGLSEAMAAGFMLGVAHLLLTTGLGVEDLNCVLGAAAGVVYTVLVQWYAGTSDHEIPADFSSVEGTSGIAVIKHLLQSSLHSAAEGIAIGVGFVVDPRLGVFLAGVFGLHNIGEGVAIADVLDRAGLPRRQAAGLCVVAKVSQPLFALATFALSPVLERLPAVALGFAAGSLAFLVLTELLPDAYRRASKIGIAGLATAAAALVVLLEDSLV